jgi:hypothetical protein
VLLTNGNNWANFVKTQNISHHGVTTNMTIILDVVECNGGNI